MISKQQFLNPTLSLTSITRLDMFMKAHSVQWNALGWMLKSFSNSIPVLLQTEATLPQSAVQPHLALFLWLLIRIHLSWGPHCLRNAATSLVARNQMNVWDQVRIWISCTRLYFCLFHLIIFFLKAEILGKWNYLQFFLMKWSESWSKTSNNSPFTSDIINRTLNFKSTIVCSNKQLNTF